jgi:hypothetical protein
MPRSLSKLCRMNIYKSCIYSPAIAASVRFGKIGPL